LISLPNNPIVLGEASIRLQYSQLNHQEAL